MENNKGISKKMWFIIVGIVLVVVAIIVIAAMVFYNQPSDVEIDELNGGEVSLTYTDDENVFTISGAQMMSDTDGMNQDAVDKYFDFTVSTDISNANNIEYSIILVKDEKNSTALNENIKIYLEKQNSGSFEKVFGPEVFDANIKEGTYEGAAMTILKATKKNSTKDNYRLRMWLAVDSQVNAGDIQNFTVKIIVDGKAS